MNESLTNSKSKDLRQYADRKEYVVMPSHLSAAVAKSTINAQAKQLWQRLWDKAKFSADHSIQASITEMTEWLPRSKRSIQRYIKLLRESGFLSVKENYCKSSQLSSTYFITAPDDIITTCESAKDRALGAVKTVESKLTKIPPDNIGTARGDVVGTPNVINKINTKKQQPTRVHVAPLEKAVTTHDQCISVVVDETLEKQKALVEKTAELRDEKLNYLRDVPKDKAALDEFSKADSRHEQAKRVLQNLLDQNERLIKRKKAIDDLPKLSSALASHAEKSLESIGYNRNQIDDYMSEIAFEARNGSLATNHKTNLPNPPIKIVNIALKLIREGRWSTPAGMRRI